MSISAKSQMPQQEKTILYDQYNEKYHINLDQPIVYVVLFRADKKIGTEGVKWTRALRDKLPKVAGFYPIIEFKRSYRPLPLFMKKHIAITHLQGEFNNPGIEDREHDENHPVLILDWQNSVAKTLGRKVNDVWVLRFEDGKETKRILGNYSVAKLNELVKY